MSTAVGGSLPPGFRFFPTDEELVAFYLRRKVFRGLHDGDVIGELDLYKFEPWDLPGLSVLRSRDGQWYFFAPRDRRNVGSSRTSRATKAGYWKATGRDRKVCHKLCTVGMKKTLVYHEGRAPSGLRTNWVMHEYRIDEAYERKKSVQSGFVVCKVFQKGGPGPRNGEQYGAPVEDEDEYRQEIGYLSETREEETQLNPQMLPPPFAVKQEEEQGENDDLLTHLLGSSPFGLGTDNSLDNLFADPIPEPDNNTFLYSPIISGFLLPTSSAEAEEEVSILDELLLTAEASENDDDDNYNNDDNSNNNNNNTINYNNNNNDTTINSGDGLDFGDYLELDDLDWPLFEDAEVENEPSGIEIRQRSGEPQATTYAEFPQRVRLQTQTPTRTNTSLVHYARRHLPSSEVIILTPRELGVFHNPQRIIEEYNPSRTNSIHEDTLSRRGSDNFSEYSSSVNEQADSSNTTTTTSTSTSTPSIPETCSPSINLVKKEITPDPNSGPCTKRLWKMPCSKAAPGVSVSAFCMLRMRDFGLLNTSEMLSKKPSPLGFCEKSIIGIGGFFGPAKEAIVSLTVKITAFICPFYNYSA